MIRSFYVKTKVMVCVFSGRLTNWGCKDSKKYIERIRNNEKKIENETQSLSCNSDVCSDGGVSNANFSNGE